MSDLKGMTSSSIFRQLLGFPPSLYYIFLLKSNKINLALKNKTIQKTLMETDPEMKDGNHQTKTLKYPLVLINVKDKPQ